VSLPLGANLQSFTGRFAGEKVPETCGNSFCAIGAADRGGAFVSTKAVFIS
jgi:hypothetical protein